MLIRPMPMASLAVVFFAALANADSAVYVVTGAQQFGTVDLATGAFTQIATTPEPDANLMPGPNGTFYSLATISGDLVSINPANGATKVIGPTGLGASGSSLSSPFSLGEAGGKLYATDFSNNLYAVNKATGAATKIGATGIPPDPTVPFTFNADGTLNLCDESLYGVGNKLYATFDSFTIDPTTLEITTKVDPNLWRIDPSTGVATQIAPTILNLDSLVDVNGVFYATQLVTVGFSSSGPEGLNKLFTFDVSNGGASFIRDVDSSAGPIFGAAPAAPEPGSVGLVIFGIAGLALVRRRRRTRLQRR